jgi:hypothetical protein
LISHTQNPYLNDQISIITSQLPKINYCRLKNGEIDYYGASYTIARNLSLDDVPYTRASWFHGWLMHDALYSELILDDDNIACAIAKECKNLVTNKEQEELLKRNGYPNANAVGLPFLYTSYQSVDRIPNSLLILPEHSLKEKNSTSSILTLDNIKSLKSKFSVIVACLGGFCAQNSCYTKQFEELDIPWITGAWINDSCALQRMRNLFSQFEFVATDSLGSHVPYSGYCGCKVQYYGQGINRSREDFLKIPFYVKYPYLINLVRKDYSLSNIESKLPFLLKAFDELTPIVDWSKMALGINNMKPSHEIAQTIGWKIRQIDSNSWEYIKGQNKGIGPNS